LPVADIGTSPSVLRDYAQAAEGTDYSHLVTPDHVLGANPSANHDDRRIGTTVPGGRRADSEAARSGAARAAFWDGNRPPLLALRVGALPASRSLLPGSKSYCSEYCPFQAGFDPRPVINRLTAEGSVVV
jgi:hypothetical protein